MTASIVAVGLDADVEVVRDHCGVPHCYARSERDAFFAQGWVHAADRLWQMEYDRRRATGRWAEVVGARGLAIDVFYRRVDLVAFVKRDVAALSADTRAMLDAYSAGVNAFIATGDRSREFAIAGVEPEPWAPWHSVAVFRVRHLLMGSARSKLWRSVVAGVCGDEVARSMVAGWGEEHIATVPPGVSCTTQATGLGDLEGGSNNWVLSGTRTATGKPLLAGDPHRELEAPNVYVQGHIACPDWDVIGIGMPGVPGFPHFGHNARVTWSITHAMADDQDLFEFDAASVQTVRTETITVKDAPDAVVDVLHTPRGPIIGDNLALCWTATIDTNTGFDAIAPMLRASSVVELFEAMRPWVEPANNLLAADVDGVIGYQTRGRIPRRALAEAAWFPLAGNDPSSAWDGWIAFDDLPRCINPETGFLFNANNVISAVPGSPYIGLDVAPPWRARRLMSALSDLTTATIDDMAALHRDTVSLPGRRWPARVASWTPLAGWNGDMDRDSAAAAAYAVFRRELFLLVLERTGLRDALGHPRNRLLPGVVPESVFWRVIDQHITAGDTSLLGGEPWEAVIDAAVVRAEKVWDGQTWGELHATGQRHALGDPTLDPPPVSVSGDLDTVMAMGYVPTSGFTARAGSVARYAFDVADWDASKWIVPLGMAGDPQSPHGLDQQRAWADGELVSAPYSRAAVNNAATTTLRLVAN